VIVIKSVCIIFATDTISDGNKALSGHN